MSNVDFIGPPPNKRKNTKHAVAASALREHPKQWGVVQRAATGKRAAAAAQAIRRARLSAYAPAGSYEAAARTVVVAGVPEHRVYVRYVGGEQ
ncbi:hypothetical protein ACH4PU_07050 [Streptomyces sp. NPDC021100]|uniref:hypothetical protein n=1 Tax=Streptomyces sp. NPDC021100 TaxID=3365114 RepID=UPI0037B7FCBE